MFYVEWLRVRAALKWTLIVLAVLFVFGIAGRIVIGRGEAAVMERLVKMQSDPGSKVTESVLPDGTKRTIVDNASQHYHVTIDDRGYQGRHIEIVDTSRDASTEHVSASAGGIHVESRETPGGNLTVIDTNGSTPFRYYLLAGLVVAMIVATILGAPLARENDGHLEISWTKPVDRSLLALQSLGVDVAGILAGLAAGTLWSWLLHILFEFPRVTFDADDAALLAMAVLGPLAWYAMLAAATSSMKRAYGVVQGIAWPIALLVYGCSYIPANAGNVFLVMIRWVAVVLATINPLNYLHFSTATVSHNGVPVKPEHDMVVQLTMLAVLAVVYGALAILQWRRVEA